MVGIGSSGEGQAGVYASRAARSPRSGPARALSSVASRTRLRTWPCTCGCAHRCVTFRDALPHPPPLPMRSAPFLVLALALCTPAAAQSLQVAFPSLPTFPNPVDLQAPDDGSNRLFVVEQAGYIRVFENRDDVSQAATFLDIDARVTSGGETGLLGLAFDPDFASNGYFYVNYTAASPLRTVISRFSVSADDPNAADPDSEVILLTVNQPFSNHNAGQLAFGPPEGPGGERYLYVGLGDGGR